MWFTLLPYLWWYPYTLEVWYEFLFLSDSCLATFIPGGQERRVLLQRDETGLTATDGTEKNNSGTEMDESHSIVEKETAVRMTCESLQHL